MGGKSKRHSGIDHISIFYESQWALLAFSRQGTTTADSNPNEIWKKSASAYFLPKQNDKNHSGWAERCQATHGNQFGQELVKLSNKYRCVKQMLGWVESLTVTLQ